MGTGDAVITGIFVGWFVLMMLRQLGLRHVFVRLPDIFQLVPGWRLFSGFTGHHDYSIQVRDSDSAPAEWQRLEDKPRTVISAVWHPALLPERVRRRQMISVVSAHRKTQNETASPHYRALVAELSTAPQLRFAERFQFRVVTERLYDPTFEAKEIYRSPSVIRTP